MDGDFLLEHYWFISVFRKNIIPKNLSSAKGRPNGALIKKMAEQNPQTIDEILEAKSLNCANIPEIYSRYFHLRTCYAIALHHGYEKQVLDDLKSNPKIEPVLDYIKGNNLEKINADIETLEMELRAMMVIQSNFGQQSYYDNNSTFIYEYGLHELPKR